MWIARHLVSTVVKNGHHGLFHRFLGSLPELEHRYLHCTCCWRSRISTADFDLLTSTLSSKLCEDEGKPLDCRYTTEQRAVILQRLNTATENELAEVKLLRGRKSVNIVEYRTRNGPFKDLESIINVPLFKHKTAMIVFNSILNPPEKKERRKTKIQLVKFIKPEVDRKLLEEASCIVSIVCGTDKIAWAHVDRGLNVLDWQQESCHNFMKGTYMASAYLDDISSVVSRMPKADLFVVEKCGITVQNTSLYPVMAHLRTVEAMLFALLGQRSEPDAPPKVLNMVRTAVGRHFGLMVGEARTSGVQMVRQMMTDSVTQKSPRVSFPHSLVVRYRHAFQLGVRKSGDELCDALLQAVAFYEKLNE
ncbi:transcription elongation factor, mitochondrial [Anguilla rostrata]|uniref:transcription elongation factor, mitochondrial n=1 Tax=Anguilla anguilla TaxID=7936 RepID=UPI0015B07A1E|nr:transcription elongation factor, mitochondrial [Anguilla anguilla]